MRNEKELITAVSNKLSFTFNQTSNVLKLVNDDCTVHFIARYRKEMTSNLDEEGIRSIITLHDKEIKLDKAKDNALDSIREQGKLTPELESKINLAEALSHVDDLYTPFKRKRKTKADLARENGFEPVALQIKNQDKIIIPGILLSQFSKEEILAGACDIVSQDIADNSRLKDLTRRYYSSKGIISSKSKADSKLNEKARRESYKFTIYSSFSLLTSKLKSYQILALNRGEDLGILNVSLDKDGLFYDQFTRKIVRTDKSSSAYLEQSVKEGYSKIFSSIGNEIRTSLTDKAQDEAIGVFQENLKKLLMLKPHTVKSLLAIDPGFRTGCKVCILEDGMPKEFSKFYLTNKSEAKIILSKLFESHSFENIVLGNGTGSDDTFELISNNFPSESEKIVVVSESGASVYSASKIGQDEFPDLDATDRGTISLGRRFIDSLSEIVKVPVTSIGVGMYQHDINQKKLETKLSETVEDVVNLVGINVNTASPYLLTYVSGLTKTTAKKIFSQKPYSSRESLRKVLSGKAFEQSIGFLRIPESSESFDNTAIHPDQYSIAKFLVGKIDNGETVSSVFASSKSNLESLYSGITIDVAEDIANSYANAGKEMRIYDGNLKKSKIVKIDDLKEGDIVNGVVRNVTQFGAFVDIGLKNDALVHISELANTFVKNPSDVISIGEEVKAKILSLDYEKGKIGLSMKHI